MSSKKLYISNFSRSTTEADLERDFSKFGEITEIVLKGKYAFVVNFHSFSNFNMTYFKNYKHSHSARKAVRHKDTLIRYTIDFARF